MKLFSVARATLLLPIRSTRAITQVGLHTTRRVTVWAVERAVGTRPERESAQWAPRSSADPEPAPASASRGEQAAAPKAERAAASNAPATQASRKSTDRDEAPATRTARRAPSKKAAVVAPALGLTEAQAEARDVLLTPSGIPAAGAGVNPDTTETDLHHPGTEPIMDPATVKAVASEAKILSRAADPDLR